MNETLQSSKKIKVRYFKKRFVYSSAIRQELFKRSGNKCSFPGCNQKLLTNNGVFIGELAAIETAVPGRRYNPELYDQTNFLDNYILLCPNHHSIIDRDSAYSADWLKKVKKEHEAKANKISRLITVPPGKIYKAHEILNIWNNNKTNRNEAYWQQLFKFNNEILSQVFLNPIINIKDQSYVGGKGTDNTYGNVIDFLGRQKFNSNAVLIEIKTPMTILLGRKYRKICYSISQELTGSIIQLLNFKNELVKNYYSLTAGKSNPLEVFNPTCTLIIGSFENEGFDTVAHKSFELFRRSLPDVNIITYDELFEKYREAIELIKSNSK